MTSTILLFAIIAATASSASVEFTAAGPFARSPVQQTVLLDKAQESLAWFLSLPPANQTAIPAEDVRRRLAPMEAFQAAVLLHDAGQTAPARGLCRMTVPMSLTPEEAFEVLEMLGERKLETLATNRDGNKDAVLQSILTTLRERSQEFIMRSLTAVEQTVLTDVMGDNASAVAMMTATGVIVKSGRIILARWLLRRFNERFSETPPTPAEAAEIVTRVGTPVLRTILDDARLIPENVNAIKTIQEAARTFWHGNQTAIPALITELEAASDDTAAEKTSKQLLALGKTVRGAISEAMLRSTSEHGVLRLVAAFLATNPTQSELLPLQALCYYSRWDDEARDALVLLYRKQYGTLPAKTDVLRRLIKRANDYVMHTIPLRIDADGCVVFWQWSEDELRVATMAVEPETAYRLFAFHYAQLAFEIAPNDAESRRLFITTWLERAAYLVGRDEDGTAIDAALVSLVSPTTARELEAALVAAIEKEKYAAATRLAIILAAHGTAESLCFANPNSAGAIRPLVQATASGDRRLRFAATDAVMRLAPDRPYPGSSLVTTALTWFARGEGDDIVISAAPKQADATRSGEELQSLGYRCVTATTCREAFQRATDSPDVVLVLVDSRCGSPPVETFVRQMRRDLRTHDIPVAIQTISTAAPQQLVTETIAGHREQTIPRAVRLRDAITSLAWLADILERESNTASIIYTVDQIDAVINWGLDSPSLIAAVLPCAAWRRSAAMQRRLAELTGHATMPLDLREKSLAAFTDSVARFGVLLRGEQVTSIYDRYNASAAEPKESQVLLNTILDVIEKSVKERMCESTQ